MNTAVCLIIIKQLCLQKQITSWILPMSHSLQPALLQLHIYLTRHYILGLIILWGKALLKYCSSAFKFILFSEATISLIAISFKSRFFVWFIFFSFLLHLDLFPIGFLQFYYDFPKLCLILLCFSFTLKACGLSSEFEMFGLMSFCQFWNSLALISSNMTLAFYSSICISIINVGHFLLLTCFILTWLLA